jgi:hypothetical protein
VSGGTSGPITLKEQPTRLPRGMGPIKADVTLTYVLRHILSGDERYEDARQKVQMITYRNSSKEDLVPAIFVEKVTFGLQTPLEESTANPQPGTSYLRVVLAARPRFALHRLRLPRPSSMICTRNLGTRLEYISWVFQFLPPPFFTISTPRLFVTYMSRRVVSLLRRFILFSAGDAKNLLDRAITMESAELPARITGALSKRLQ